MVKPIHATTVEPAQAGANTAGGIDGDAIHVTTLAPSGPGSLRAALEATRPRLVVFDVGGVIDLAGRSIAVRHPHLTLAGQTAPDPGITIIRGGIVVETHDVVIQHIAVRPGDRGMATGEWTPDALGVRRAAQPVHDVLFEHCSATWAVDENLSTSGPADVDASDGRDATAHHITLRNCLIAEALSRSTHPKGEHSKGTLVHDGVRDVFIEGCLYAHNRERNPRLKGGTTAVIINSVMYNWGSGCVGVGAQGNRRRLAPAEAVVAGNVAIAGPDTRSRLLVKGLDDGARVHLRDNLLVGEKLTLADARVVQLREAPSWAPDLRPLPPREAMDRVLRYAGSRPARRDPIDERIVQSVLRREGRIIDSQEDVGGYPVRPATKRVLKVPPAGERATWLKKLSHDVECGGHAGAG